MSYDTIFYIGTVWVIIGFVFTMIYANVMTAKEKKCGCDLYDEQEDNKQFLIYFLLQMSCFILGPLSFLSIIALKKRLEKIPDPPVIISDEELDFYRRGGC